MVKNICTLKAKNINRLEKLLNKIILHPELCRDENGKYVIYITNADDKTKEKANTILQNYLSNLEEKIDKLYQRESLRENLKKNALSLLAYIIGSNIAFIPFVIAATGFVASTSGAPADAISPSNWFNADILAFTLYGGSFIGYLAWSINRERKEFDKNLYEELYNRRVKYHIRAKYLLNHLELKYVKK